MNLTIKTLATYNNAAPELAAKFEKSTNRFQIMKAFDMLGISSPRVLEIGFGSGKDIETLSEKAKSYTGIDYSSAMCRVAQSRHPEACLECADILTWEPKGQFDVIFAFASLVHLQRGYMEAIFSKIASWLSSGGVFAFSLRHGKYREEVVEDEYGTRVFYRYDADAIAELLGDDFRVPSSQVVTTQGREWLNIICWKE